MTRPFFLLIALGGLLAACGTGLPVPDTSNRIIGLGTDRRAILSKLPENLPWSEADYRRNSYNVGP